MSEQLVAGLNIDVAHAGPKGVKAPLAYLAFGRLSDKGLEIYQLRQQPFHNLAQELTATKFTAAGLNFPFSMPAEFIEFCAQKATRTDFQSWQEYVEYLFSVDAQQFAGLVREFKRDALRSTDKQQVGLLPAGSALNGNGSATELVYSGIRNLAGLDPAKFCILPFHDAQDGLCSVLEVCSQGSLAALKLLRQTAAVAGRDSSSGSNKSNVQTKHVGPTDSAVEQRELRRKVIENMLEMKATSPLSFKEYPDLFVSHDVRSACIESAHALDAVTACYTVGLWVVSPLLFEDPYEGGDEKVLLEGWAYVPR